MDKLRKQHMFLYGYNIAVIKYGTISALHERITSKGELIKKNYK